MIIVASTKAERGMRMKTTTGKFRIPLAAVALLAMTSASLAQVPGMPGRRPPAPEVIPAPIVAPIPAVKPLVGPGRI